MRNVSENSFRENETHLILNNFFPKIVPVLRMWESVVEADRPQMAI
jgi:hypothetical protein